MSKKMQKDALLVLCVLAVLAIAWSIGVHRTSRQLNNIVKVADSRTEHLRDRIQVLEKKVSILENKMLKQVEAMR